MIFIIYIILIIYIIYLYLLSGVSKNLPQRTAACMLRPYCYLLFVICYDCARTGLPRRGRTDMCYDLIVICYLLFVMIAHAQGCLVGGEQTCVTTLLLFVICYLL